MTPAQLEAIKERATELLCDIHPAADPVAIRNTVELYVRVLDQAHEEIMPKREMTVEEMVAHDAAVGLPGWRRVS